MEGAFEARKAVRESIGAVCIIEGTAVYNASFEADSEIILS